MPNKIGLFLGLTGARINGTDALALGVADFGMASDDFDVLIQALTTADWSDDATKIIRCSMHCLVSCIITTLYQQGGFCLIVMRLSV